MRLRTVACVLLALCAACGGKASEREQDTEIEEPAPVEELPSSLEVLELRRRIAWDALPAGSIGCEPDDYSLRMKVNFQVRTLLRGTCYATPAVEGRSSSSVTLSDADVARVQDAYRELRISSVERCTPSDRVFTLDVSPEHGTHLLYGDDEHSGCPVTGLEREQYVTGLDELFAVLASLAPP